MKKLGRKLVLSSLSLGLAVVTLSTTTYAWYTSNTVSAKGMNGAIAGDSAEGLLISKDGVNFSAAITFTADDITALTHNGSALKPLQYKAGEGGSLKTLADNGVEAEAGAGHEYLQFSVFVKTTASELAEGQTSIPVYFNKLAIKNTTETLPTYKILSDYKVGGSTGTSGWTQKNGVYSLDAIQALNLSLAAGEARTESDGVVKSTKIAGDYYSLNNYFATEDLKASVNLASTVDALDYYNAIMHGGDADTSNYVSRPSDYAPADLVKTATTAETTDPNSLEVVSITEVAKAYEIVFTVWLDGWDAYCFDACRGQSFSIDFGFTTVKKDSAVSKSTNND